MKTGIQKFRHYQRQELWREIKHKLGVGKRWASMILQASALLILFYFAFIGLWVVSGSNTSVPKDGITLEEAYKTHKTK